MSLDLTAGVLGDGVHHHYSQIAFVTRDAYRAMNHWSALLGLGPWSVRRLSPQTMDEYVVAGRRVEEDFEYVCAVAWAGDVEWEIIQPVRGPMIFWEHLDRHGEGLHHVKNVYPTDRVEQVVRDFEARGGRVLGRGRIEEDVHVFLDTEATLGFLLEVGNQAPLSDAPELYPAP